MFLPSAVEIKPLDVLDMNKTGTESSFKNCLQVEQCQQICYH